MPIVSKDVQLELDGKLVTIGEGSMVNIYRPVCVVGEDVEVVLNGEPVLIECGDVIMASPFGSYFVGQDVEVTGINGKKHRLNCGDRIVINEAVDFEAMARMVLPIRSVIAKIIGIIESRKEATKDGAEKELYNQITNDDEFEKLAAIVDAKNVGELEMLIASRDIDPLRALDKISDKLKSSNIPYAIKIAKYIDNKTQRRTWSRIFSFLKKKIDYRTQASRLVKAIKDSIDTIGEDDTMRIIRETMSKLSIA